MTTVNRLNCSEKAQLRRRKQFYTAFENQVIQVNKYDNIDSFCLKLKTKTQIKLLFQSSKI